MALYILVVRQAENISTLFFAKTMAKIEETVGKTFGKNVLQLKQNGHIGDRNIGSMRGTIYIYKSGLNLGWFQLNGSRICGPRRAHVGSARIYQA